MTKYLIFIISLFSFGQISGQQPYKKKILFELFTSTFCDDCVIDEGNFRNLCNYKYPDDVILLHYPSLHSGNDINYIHNSRYNEQGTTNLDNRTDFYDVDILPHLRMNGHSPFFYNNDTFYSPMNITSKTIDRNKQLSAFINVNSQHLFNGDSINIRMEIENRTYKIVDNVSLYYAAVEKNVFYSHFSGSNYIKSFNNVFRELLSPQTGIYLGYVLPVTDTVINKTHKIPGSIIDPNELVIISWLQNNITQEIYNSSISSNINIKTEPNIFIEDTYLAGENKLCDSELKLYLKLKNNSDTTHINKVYLRAYNDFTDYSDTIEKIVDFPSNSTIDIEILEEELKPSSGYFKIQILGYNHIDKKDRILFDNFSNLFYLREVELKDSIFQGYESEDFKYKILDGLKHTEHGKYIRNSNGDNYFTSIHFPQGGFAQSNFSFQILMYPWDWADSLEIIYYLNEGLKLENKNKVNVSFDYTFTTIDSFSNAGMEIYASTDCGETWNKVFHEYGLDFITIQPLTYFYYPLSKDYWKSKKFSFSVDNKDTELYFKFEFNREGGNNLFLDNLRITSERTTALKENSKDKFIATLNPNPASALTSLNLSGNIKGSTDIKIYSLDGRIIYQKSLMEFERTIVLPNFNKGIYFINILNDNNYRQLKLIKK